MKIQILAVITIWFAVLSCNQAQDKPFKNEDKAAIEKEITTMVDSIAITANELNTDYFKRFIGTMTNSLLFGKASQGMTNI